MSAKSTKKAKRASQMREHYDFRRAKRGRFPDLAGAHVVVVSPAIWKHLGATNFAWSPRSSRVAFWRLFQSSLATFPPSKA